MAVVRRRRMRRRGGQESADGFTVVTIFQSIVTLTLVAGAYLLFGLPDMAEYKSVVNVMLTIERDTSEIVSAVIGSYDSDDAMGSFAQAILQLTGEEVAVSGAKSDTEVDEEIAVTTGAAVESVSTPLFPSSDKMADISFSGELELSAMSNYFQNPYLLPYETPTFNLSLPGDVVSSARISSGFGFRTHPISGNQDFHTGVDLATSMGADITAPMPGTVVEVGYSRVYGNYIAVEHSPGVVSYYCHCQAIIAKVGDEVIKGDVIALVGSTGVSTGPHVHFEIMVNGEYVDPTATSVKSAV